MIAGVDLPDLSPLREALSPLRTRSILVSAAEDWSSPGCVLVYRGKNFRKSPNVYRVEITCIEAEVQRVVSAVDRALSQGRERTGVEPPEEASARTGPRGRSVRSS